MTTNYDLALERAFLEAEEEFDVLLVPRQRPLSRQVLPHRARASRRTGIDLPNTYATELSLERAHCHPEAMHGQIDSHAGSEWESFVVSEDDHIDYLAHADIANP